MKIFLLYNGSSPDGTGGARYIGKTEDKEVARKHYEKCQADPYSTGYVKMVTDTEDKKIQWWDDWSAL